MEMESDGIEEVSTSKTEEENENESMRKLFNNADARYLPRSLPGTAYAPGDCFEKRKDFAHIHSPPQSGIYGTTEEGCKSVVLSGGYKAVKEDEDNGDIIIYTGAGGMDKNRTVQLEDQDLIRGNGALYTSFHTQIPIHVSRGHLSNSIYAPEKGYRYDGLYRVTKYWKEIANDGKHTCYRFKFEKLPDQPPIPTRNHKRPLSFEQNESIKKIRKEIPLNPHWRDSKFVVVQKPEEKHQDWMKFAKSLVGSFENINVVPILSNMIGKKCSFCSKKFDFDTDVAIRHLESHKINLKKAFTDEEKEKIDRTSEEFTAKIKSAIESKSQEKFLETEKDFLKLLL